MIINNVINKRVESNGFIRLFFQVEADKGYSAGIITFEIRDLNNAVIAEHRRRLVAAKGFYRGHFFFDITVDQFEKFTWFKWTFTNFSLKSKSGGDVKAEKFEDLTDVGMIGKNEKILEGVLK
jgi:hypothetical protein